MANKDDKRSDSAERNSGHIQHDDRGNAVWQWAADTARTAMASTSQVLRKLNVTGLSLESDDSEVDTEPESKLKRQPQAVARKPGSSAASSRQPSKAKRGIDSRRVGFDPYSTNAGVAKRTAAAAQKPAGPAARTAGSANRPAAGSPPRRSWWQRLLGRG